MGLGLVALIPVLGILGGVLVSADVGSATGWILLAVGVAWLLLTIWWAQRNAVTSRRQPGSSGRGVAPLSRA